MCFNPLVLGLQMSDFIFVFINQEMYKNRKYIFPLFLVHGWLNKHLNIKIRDRVRQLSKVKVEMFHHKRDLQSFFNFYKVRLPWLNLLFWIVNCWPLVNFKCVLHKPSYYFDNLSRCHCAENIRLLIITQLFIRPRI